VTTLWRGGLIDAALDPPDVDPYIVVGEATKFTRPRCPDGRRHLLTAYAVETLGKSTGGGITECELCRCRIFVPPSCLQPT
jgi:hypothetical protein